MVAVRPAKIEEWQVLRDIRLDALRDAPDSFGSTYAENAALAETDWRRKVSRGGTFFAFVPEVNGTEPSGLVDGFEETPGTVELVSLWVRPQARGLGVGDALVAAVIDWAEKRNAASVHLWLTDTNQYARMLYERCGFSSTKECQPLPSKPDLTEVGMIRPVRPPSLRTELCPHPEQSHRPPAGEPSQCVRGRLRDHRRFRRGRGERHPVCLGDERRVANLHHHPHRWPGL